MPKKVPEPILLNWGVYRLRRKAERFAVVSAQSADEALKSAFVKLAIPEHERFRISVQRER